VQRASFDRGIFEFHERMLGRKHQKKTDIVADKTMAIRTHSAMV